MAKLDDSDLEHTQAAEEEVSQAYSNLAYDLTHLSLLYTIN